MSVKQKPDGPFVVCVETGDYPASLQRWKIYRVLSDAEAAQHGQLRITDESGEDYLFPQQYFAFVDLPANLQELYIRSGA